MFINNGNNALHGGIKGFDKRVWSVARTSEENSEVALTLSLTSEDGEESFPGTVKVDVEYRFTNDNEIRISYRAETDKTTPLSLTDRVSLLQVLSGSDGSCRSCDTVMPMLVRMARRR